MKMSYDKAAADVILFNNSDVITTSGGYCEPYLDDGYWVELNCEGMPNGAKEWVNGSNGNC